jgi:hypothetical protein
MESGLGASVGTVQWVVSGQAVRAYAQFTDQPTPLAQNTFLEALRDRNERLHYKLLVDHLSEMLPTVTDPGELGVVPSGRGHSQDRDLEPPGGGQVVEGPEQLLAGQVPGDPEQDEGVGLGLVASHRSPHFSPWPPNSLRMAESSLSARSASPLELNRS